MKQTPAQEEPKAIKAFQVYETFCKALLDAYIVVNLEGQVLKCNQLFSIMINQSVKQILKANHFSNLLNFMLGDHQLTIEEILALQGPTRFDEVRGELIGKQGLNMILGIFPLQQDGVTVGTFILLRDVTAETNLQDKYKVKATQSITDRLTGLYNRTFFEQYLPTTLQGMKRRYHPAHCISVLMVDIDHFKTINDTFGHPAGDYIIENVAKIFRLNFRKSDILCRYGGEEFLAILPSTDLEGARMAAEKLREAVATFSYEYNGAVIPVTISLGLAEIAVEKETSKEAIARADAALYEAKRRGRNRVCIHKGNNDIQ